MRNYRTGIATLSLITLSAVAGAALADDAPAAAAPAKPTLPAISDPLTASGLTATGYVSGTFGYQGYSASDGATAPADYSSFTLQQAAFTLADQPMTGWGGLVNVIAGQNIYVPNYSPAGPSETTTQFQLAQAYAQYATGPWTIIGGKFTTLVGAEVLASVGNTNITRSLLYDYEPVTHTGVRVTYAATGTVNLTLGVNNGWVYSDEVALGGDKTLEAGVAWTPNKVFSWSVQGYYGRDLNASGIKSEQTLLDTVLTWNATSALTVIGSVDWGQVDDAFGVGTKDATWTGFAGYLNYALSDTWRVSLRGEYYDDNNGYLTGVGPDFKKTMDEGTLTFGYDPTKNVELRLEGRYDTYDTNDSGPKLNVTQGWLEALYHF